jgi:hypothetical protein
MTGRVLPRGANKGRVPGREARRLKAARELTREDQICGQRLEELAKMHSGEAFYALDDSLEAAVFSVLVAGLDFDLLGHFAACRDPVALEGAEDGSEAAFLCLEAAL